jgi:hypothetical protein
MYSVEGNVLFSELCFKTALEGIISWQTRGRNRGRTVIHTQAGRQTGRQADRQSGRQADRPAGRSMEVTRTNKLTDIETRTHSSRPSRRR